MEKALLTGRCAPEPAALKGVRWAVAGSEFCQNRLPGPGVLQTLRSRGLKLSLATSVLTDCGLAAAEKLISAARRRGLLDEVIVNDWGLLARLKKYRGLRLSIGRLLAVELSATEPGWTRRFVREHGIVSAEADEPGLARRLKARAGLKISWHKPHAFKALTTYCPFERHFKAVCGYSCEGRELRLANPHLKEPLLLIEKAYLTPGASLRPPPGAWRLVGRLDEHSS
jgi:hypothetical protein